MFGSEHARLSVRTLIIRGVTHKEARQYGLQVACAITKDNKDNTLLVADTVNPATDTDAFASQRFKGQQLGLDTRHNSMVMQYG
jgi:hypothetical protein